MEKQDQWNGNHKKISERKHFTWMKDVTGEVLHSVSASCLIGRLMAVFSWT